MKKTKIKKILIFLALIIIFLLCCIPIKDYNCKYPLNIVSAYGDNEAYHPKVVNFNKQWNGYKYWMSYTPYPQGNDSKENPHIVASNDLVNWETPTGLINPIDERINDGEPKQYNSDSHLVYNNNLDRIECYWRFVDDINNQVIIYRVYTTDGINFSEKEISSISYNRKEHDYVSPAIIYEDNTYKMWYVEQNLIIKYEESNDGINWSEPVIVNLKYEDSKLKTWHLDVILTEQGYEMISVAFDKWDNRNNMKLYYSHSNDETKEWTVAKEILTPTKGTKYWDNKGIYRSCMIYENGIYIVFYSGTNMKMNHGIGIMYGKDIMNLKKVNIDFSDNNQVLKLVNSINKERRYRE